MGARRIAAIALSAALLAGGTGAAIAAVTKDEGEKAEQAVLDDAAKRLSVTPEKLREALIAAQDAQLEKAVEDGELTRKQADEIKAARNRSGRVLGPLAGPRLHKRFAPGAGRPGTRLRGGPLGADLAKALGTAPEKLREALRSGTSLAELAKANGKTVAEVRSALEAIAKARLDKAVADGDLTRKQADRILEHLGARVDALASGRRLRLPRHHRHRFAPGPPHEVRPGWLLPGEHAPQLTPPGGATLR